MAAGVDSLTRPKRQLAEEAERYRGPSESDRHWHIRRQFIVRHMQDYPGSRTDQLLALSMVWTNHVFLGCRYSSDLLERVFQMAEGIDVDDIGSSEFVPGSTTNKRSNSDNGENPTAKRKPPSFRPRFRFEPVAFVSSSSKDEEDGKKKSNQSDKPRRWADLDEDVLPLNSLTNSEEKSVKVESSPTDGKTNPSGKSSNGPLPPVSSENSSSFDYDSLYKSIFTEANENKTGNCINGITCLSTYMSKIQQNYSAKYEAYHSNPSSDLYPTMRGPDFSKTPVGNKQGYKGLGFTQTKKSKSRKSSKKNASKSVLPEPLQPLSSKSSSGGFSPSAVKSRQTFFNMLQISVSRKLSSLGGFSNQLNHSDVLSSCIQTCKTNPQYFYVSLKEIPPADVPKNKKVLTDGYACELRCQGVYLSTGYAGSKIGARDRASEQALKLFLKDVVVEVVKRKCKSSCIDDLILCEKNTPRNDIPPALKKPDEKIPSKDPANKGSETNKQNTRHSKDVKKKNWMEFVILETAKNAVCILNNSAQFNRMTVDYKFQLTPSQVWQCRVFIEDHFIAEAYGTKKLVKHTAAEKALSILRETQPIVKSSKPGNSGTAISRNAILGRSTEEALKQKITEDNIGNQLLRKMGWKGGGLGKEGEGIAEPITVKEQFKREGLGLEMNKSGSKLNKRDIEDLIKNYARSEKQEELTFSKELTNEERMQIHQMAAKYGLKSKSYGKGKERYLVVSRKVRVDDIMNQLAQEGQVGRFELVVPGSSN
ncbi:NF-kappa-B-repressing factor isoform X2 [Narcine bancroftii]|uniref:NF-kappa-B-repressing factor isoform X2 n=1 Tax=Narcine bancroftii TaxID=1343680 RepID=UPI0038312A06